MTNPTINQFNEQFDKFFGGPARAFAELTVNHMESMVNSQVEASRAYTDLSLKQIRSAMEVKAPQDVQSFIQGQQEVAKEFGERMKGDAEALVNMNRQFAEEAQKLTQANVQSATKAASKAK